MDETLKRIAEGADWVQQSMQKFGKHLIASSAELSKQIAGDAAKDTGAGFMDKLRSFFSDNEEPRQD